MENIVLKIATISDKEHVGFLVSMINQVYVESENELWVDEHERIDEGSLNQAIDANEIILALLNDEVCGCIHLEQKTLELSRFKMLVANPKYKGKGVGSLLVDFAERTSVKNGAKKMQLELLVPTEFEHAEKVFLTNWYTRIGYQKISEHDVDYVHEGLSRLLKTGCVAEVYQKVIG